MINGAHLILYANDAQKARAFFKDVLGLSHVDAGHGWLIFALPPAEIAAHPTDSGENSGDDLPRCELHLMCADLAKTMNDLKKKGVEFVGGISEQPWGLFVRLVVPGAGPIGLYQPKHPVAIQRKN
jgi:catechol 2,3-dioxygenase-like lactoylglutathione lyase family enzyme